MPEAGEPPPSIRIIVEVADVATDSPILDALLVVKSSRALRSSRMDGDTAAEKKEVEALAETALAGTNPLPEDVLLLEGGKDGHFEAELEPGSYLVAAAHSAYFSAMQELKVSPRAPGVNLRMRLSPRSARIRGKVRFLGGPPGPCSIHTMGADGVLEHAQVAQDGSFELGEVPGGKRTVLLRATHPSGDPIEIVRSVEVNGGDDLELDFDDLAQGSFLHGTAGGAAQPGDTVFLYQDTGGALLGRDTVLDADGTFRFAGLEPGGYFLIVGPLMKEIEVPGGSDASIDLVVPRVSVRGQALDSSGNPIPSARVFAVRSGVPLDSAVLRRFAVDSKSDPQGSFVLEPLDETSYTVEVQAAGFVTQRLALDASSIRSLEVRMEPARS